MNWEGLLILCAGLFALAAAIGNWDWFFEHSKARIVVSLFGRTGARGAYGVLGTGLVAVSLLTQFDLFAFSRSQRELTFVITAEYRNADRISVAETIAFVVEQELMHVSGVRWVESISEDGRLMIRMPFDDVRDREYEKIRILNGLKLSTPLLPKEFKDVPFTVTTVEPPTEPSAIVIALTGPQGTSWETLHEWSQQVQEKAVVEGIAAKLDVFPNEHENENRVDVDRAKCKVFGISPEEVVDRLQTAKAGKPLSEQTIELSDGRVVPLTALATIVQHQVPKEIYSVNHRPAVRVSLPATTVEHIRMTASKLFATAVALQPPGTQVLDLTRY
jgi:multidrug efflux pump subunit AcrB